MTARGRGYSNSHDWDSTRDDYNSSTYDPQYQDDNASSGVLLDHCRLYVTNVPRALNEEGLRAAFSKYGTLVQSFLSRDPNRKFGLIKYETPGEAKLAMMKINRTEPLKLVVTIAHKNRPQDEQRKSNDNKHDRTSTNGTRDRSVRDDASVGSRGKYSRKQEEAVNGDEMDDIPADDDFGYDDPMDPQLHLELESLKLEQLRLREEQLMCKHRMILLKQADKKPLPHNTVSSRCILPDGKIVIRNVERAAETRDADVSYGAGAGDSHKIPALQSVCSRACVGCGRPAASYCAGCGVTPYCGERCQRRDWPERHRAVCHNLARLSGNKGGDYDENEPPEQTITHGGNQPAAPLRPPHAPRQHSDSGSDNNARSQQSFKKKPANNNRNNSSDNSNRNSGNNSVNKRQGDMRRPNVTPNAEVPDDEEWAPKKPNPTPNTPPVPVQPRKLPNFNKLINEAPTYKSTKAPIAVAEPAVRETSPVVKATSPVVKDTSPVVKGTNPVVKATNPVVKATNPVVKATNPVVKETVPVKKLAVDPTPVKNLVPKQYLIETLNIGDSAVLSVDAVASDCRSSRGGFICLSMSERYEADYQLLCESFGDACAAYEGGYRLVPGETCSYLDPDDGGWYRARCLSPTTLALLDASRLARAAAARCGPLPPHYRAIPEFCCLLLADGFQVGMSLTCTLLARSGEGFRVSVANENGVTADGELLRWNPTVEYPPTPTAPSIPEVPRPEVANNGRVVLVHATAMDKAFVRPADGDSQRMYDDILERVALCGRNESPLQEPPAKGDTVLGQFEDGLHYRALCKRTNVKQNKYLLEYIEFGNVEISPLEKLYPCPPSLGLAAVPALVSLVSLADSDEEFTPPALQYVEQLKQDNEEIILTVASGGKTAPSGGLVNLTLAKNKENINKKIIDMCTPEWKKIEERGGDVVESPRLMYSDVEFVELPTGGCELAVLDASMLPGGVLSACPRGLPHADYVLDQLTQKMADYCNSEIGRQPYLPKPEELCIAQFPPYEQWFRAVVAAQPAGAGGGSARVCYLDYGNVATVPVRLLRKMLPDFIVGLPVLASHLMIRDFPEEPTAEMLSRAREFLQLDGEGRGVLSARRCQKQDGDVYLVDAPELIAHIHQHDH